MKSVRAKAKITTPTKLSPELARLQKRGERIVFTNGCFDLLHLGHLRSLEEASSLGDKLVVAVNRDASVRRAKGKHRPIQNERQRMEMLAGLACVDWVVPFAADTPLRVIRRLRPDVLAKGGEWALSDIVGGDDVLSWGGKVVRLRVIPGIRTTELIDAIQKA
ncbi:MAG: adenylyltransferase/cytidyltransferase family protein [Myxococcota bacterium]